MFSQVEDVLQNKACSELLASVEGRLRKMEERSVMTEEFQNRIGNEVDQMCNIHYEPVAITVQGALQQDKAEEMEIESERRKERYYPWCMMFLNPRQLSQSKD